jgi:hypothetical protein
MMNKNTIGTMAHKCPICRKMNAEIQKIQESQSEKKCYVCVTNDANIMYSTCAHKCVCESCFEKIDKKCSDPKLAIKLSEIYLDHVNGLFLMMREQIAQQIEACRQEAISDTVDVD